MFTIGFKEIAFLALVAGAVWFGYWLNERRRRPRPRTSAKDAQSAVEAMAECPACGTYYAAGLPPRCDRPACPLRPGARP